MYGVILTDDVTELNFDQSQLNVKRTKIFHIFHKLASFSNIVLRKLLNCMVRIFYFNSEDWPQMTP